MTSIGYLRVSTTDQNTDRQLDGVDVDRTFSDHVSGGSADRPGLEQLLDFVRDGDTVHVHSIDRLARDLRDLLRLIEELTGKGVTIRFEKEALAFKPDGRDPFQALQLQIIGAVAQFERSMIRERQREGIEKAKARGVYKGRKPSVDADRIRELHREGVKPAHIARQLGVGRTTVYRALGVVG